MVQSDSLLIFFEYVEWELIANWAWGYMMKVSHFAPYYYIKPVLFSLVYQCKLPLSEEINLQTKDQRCRYEWYVYFVKNECLVKVMCEYDTG